MRLLLAKKLIKYREQFQVSLSELSEFTGISKDDLEAFESGQKQPSGDEILILADFYKCDYRFFISNDKIAPDDQTDTLFRRYGKEFSKEDRWAVQEILFLADCEFFLSQQLGFLSPSRFTFRKVGNYYKGQGRDAAAALRRHLKYADNEVPLDIYRDFRSLGIHVFRRRLNNSKISGLYIRPPVAGKCILINYLEDVYRQRFTAAHEAGHAILDEEEDVIVSFTKWKKDNLVEIRANTFAANYLVPPNFAKSIPNVSHWDAEKAISWSNRLKVSTEALANALVEYGLIGKNTEGVIKSVKVPREIKTDPELPQSLSARAKERKETLLKRGLSTFYVNLCFEGYRRNIISAARMAEMLLVEESELREIAQLYDEELGHGS